MTSFEDTKRVNTEARAIRDQLKAKLGNDAELAKGATDPEGARIHALVERARGLRAGDGASAPRQMLDPAVAPKSGETHGESLVRRHAEHSAKMLLEGKPALKFSEWVKADKLVHAEVHKRGEAQELEPQRTRGQAQAAVLREVEEAAARLMLSDRSLGKGSAQMLALKNDPDLSARYRGLFTSFPEGRK